MTSVNQSRPVCFPSILSEKSSKYTVGSSLANAAAKAEARAALVKAVAEARAAGNGWRVQQDYWTRASTTRRRRMRYSGGNMLLPSARG